MAFQTSQPEAPTRNWLPEILLALGLVIMTIVVSWMIYHDSFIDGSTYSNRSFALPGAGFSFMLVSYTCIRFKFLPLWIRLVAAPFAFFAGYLAIGLIIILINSAI